MYTFSIYNTVYKVNTYFIQIHRMEGTWNPADLNNYFDFVHLSTGLEEKI